MPLRVRRNIRPLREPRADSEAVEAQIRITFAIELMREEGQFSLVRAVAPGGLVVEGWIESAHLVEREIAASDGEAIDIPTFAELVIIAARRFQTASEYLLAISWIESNIRNKINNNTGAAGPFQFLTTTWAGLVDKLGSAITITLADINNWKQQPWMAAAFARENMDGLMSLGALGGRLPTAAELYLAHLLGLPAAKVVLSAPRAESIELPLLEFYKSRSDAEIYVRDTVIGGNPDLLMSGGAVKTVEAVLATMADKLDDAFAQVVAKLPEPAAATTLVFPLESRPAQDYRTGGRRFEADRPGGRKHAACDLIAPQGTRVLAMADGVVIRGPYPFYLGTHALEVRHDDGMVVRYGEIMQDLPPRVSLGTRVSRGQEIAKVGLLNSGSSMLHLEIYRGTETGSLTQAGNPFKRRGDLTDPTPFLDEAPRVGELPREPGGAPLAGQLPRAMSGGQTEINRWVAALRAVETDGASAVTAGQDGLAPGVEASRKMAEADRPRVIAIVDRFVDVAGMFGMPAAVLAAIASRESRCGNILRDGLGTTGHAFGIMQIDERSHVPDGKPDPASVAHIEQAAGILDHFLQQLMRNHPDWADVHLLKGAAAAYNMGVSNVQTIDGIDRGTTGDDYGSDVMARAKYYLEHPTLSVFRA